MKKGMSAAMATILFVTLTLVRPEAGFAGEKEDLQSQLKQNQQQLNDLNQKKTSNDKTTNAAKSQIAQDEKKLEEIQTELQSIGTKLTELKKQENDVSIKLASTQLERQEAENRVASREKQLKSRVRLMYMNGSVSYLDVILSSTSFSDFLDRFDMLKSIIGQDKEILDANEADRDLIAQREKEIAEQRSQIQQLAAQQEQLHQTRLAQEKQKQVQIASNKQKVEESEDLDETIENNLLSLARQRSAIQKKLDELAAAEAKKNKAPAQSAFTYTGGKFAWPVPSSTRISDTFGMRIDPIKKVQKLHKGIDIAAPNGTTIVAAEDGVVLISGWVNGYGNTVVIDHGNGVWTWYGHIRDGGLKVEEGDTVKRGQKIAEVGSTGDSTGNHCHFEVRINEVAKDPLPYLK